jgi:hypothetical protein
MPEYGPAIGSHAPGHLRHVFATLIETGKVATEELFDQSVIAGRDPADWLCGQLWNCTDQMPAWERSELGGTVQTYAQAARLGRAQRAASAA